MLFNDERSVEGHPRHRRRAPALRHDRLPADLHHRHARAHGGGDRRGARRARAPACPACSASIWRGRSSIPSARACTTRRYMRADRGGGHPHHDLARRRPHAGDAGARKWCRPRRSRGWPRRACSSRPATPRRPRDAAARRGGAASPATRTSSTPCRRSPAASRARSARRSTTARRWCGLIVDLHHVSAPALRVALAAKGADRMMLVTDAMPTVGTDLDELRAARPDDLPRGTAGSPPRTARSPAPTSTWRPRSATPSHRLGLPPRRRARAWRRWRRPNSCGLDDELGRIAPGYRASLVLLDDELKVRATWIDGAEA